MADFDYQLNQRVMLVDGPYKGMVGTVCSVLDNGEKYGIFIPHHCYDAVHPKEWLQETSL